MPKCECCGKEFEPTCHITKQKYCSDKCRNKVNNAKRYYDGKIDVCLECGIKIDQSGTKGRWKRFCSDKCRQSYNYKRVTEKRRNRIKEPKICPNCGKEFMPNWSGNVRKFCSDEYRIEWWREYHKAHPKEDENSKCLYCGNEFRKEKWHGGKYCSRDCYVKAMGNTKEIKICQWCGEEFWGYKIQEQKYCSVDCATESMHPVEKHKKASHRIHYKDIESWKENLQQASRNGRISRKGREVRLVCGTTSMNIGIDGLLSIIKYELDSNPYDGRIYAFNDYTGNILKYIMWDGASFIEGKRKAQSGTYPWPEKDREKSVEISENEFDFLLSKSIVPTKEKKNKKDTKNADFH